MHEATFVVGMGRKRPGAEGLFHFMNGTSLLKSRAVKMLDACSVAITMQQNQSNEEPVPYQ